MKTTHFDVGGQSRYTISQIPQGDHQIIIFWYGNNSGKAMRHSKGYLHWNYIAEKMNLEQEIAKAVALFINMQVPGYKPTEKELPRQMKGNPEAKECVPVAKGQYC